MDKNIQDEIWDQLSEETKQEYREKYKFHLADSKREMKCDDGGYDLTVLRSETIVKELETMFGTHNLNPDPPTPKTWEDIEEEWGDLVENFYTYCTSKDFEQSSLCKKMVATYKIAKLIDLGYGGMVSEEEWKDDNIKKYCIIIDNGKIDKAFDMIVIKQFIAFHTSEQREEFMSHESNRQLVKQYYMM